MSNPSSQSNPLPIEEKTENKLWALVNNILGLNSNAIGQVNPVDVYQEKMSALYKDKDMSNPVVDSKVQELEKQLAELTQKLSEYETQQLEPAAPSNVSELALSVDFPQPIPQRGSRKSHRDKFSELCGTNFREAARYFNDNRAEILKGVRFFSEV